MADDDSAIRTLVAHVLARHGYLVSTAVDGMDAIAQLDHNSFDLLVLDLMMPRIDGAGVIRHLAMREKRAPPILVMTAAVPDILKRLTPDGVAGIITKPFDLDELVHYAELAVRGIATQA